MENPDCRVFYLIGNYYKQRKKVKKISSNYLLLSGVLSVFGYRDGTFYNI